MSEAEIYDATPTSTGGVPFQQMSPAQQVEFLMEEVNRSREGADLNEAVEIAEFAPEVAMEALLAVRTCTMPSLHALVLKHIEERIALDATIQAGGLN